MVTIFFDLAFVSLTDPLIVKKKLSTQTKNEGWTRERVSREDIMARWIQREWLLWPTANNEAKNPWCLDFSQSLNARARL
jgi:hypothetical protein